MTLLRTFITAACLLALACACSDDSTGVQPKPDSGKGADKGRQRGKLAGKPGAAEPKRGINKIPRWLRNDVGLHDWIASSVVIIGGGVLMCLLVWFLALVWPG